MRQILIAFFAYCILNLFIPKIWESLMSSAPRVVVNITTFVAVLVCIGFVTFADPVFTRLKNPGGNPASSTALVIVLAIALAGAAWWIFAIPHQKNIGEATAFEPPISVTGASIDPKPYKPGQVLRTILRINNTVSGLKVRAQVFIWVGQVSPDQLAIDQRQVLEADLWKQFESNPPKTGFSVSWVRGDSFAEIEGPTLTEDQATRLNGPNGVVYFMGQIDYGDGTIDCGGYVRSSRPDVGVFSIEHNGPAKKRIIQQK